MKTFIIATLFIAQYASSVLGCQTTTGANCILPFKYREMTYDKCTKADHNKYWCATSLNADGTLATYGDCKSDCPMDIHNKNQECLTTGGIPCTFPFTYKGVVHNKCTPEENNGVQWCAINKYPGSTAAYHFGQCDMSSKCQK